MSMRMAKASKEEAEALFQWLQSQEDKGVDVPAWRRTVFGYIVLAENCCDPEKSFLDWKPEIAAALDSLTPKASE